MYAVGQNEAPRLPARVRVNGAPADAVLWLDATRAARPLPSPSSAPTVAEGAAGDLTGAYRWLVAFGSAVMVSYPSPVSALLTVTAKRVNLSVVPTSTDGRVTKRRIYRTLAGGSVYKLVGEIADNVTADFEDNVADGALTDEYLAVTVFADGNAMDEGADRSRYVNHATQATAGFRPTYKVGILNGRPVVRFDGSDDRLVLSNTLLANAGAMTLVVVYKVAAASGDAKFVVGIRTNGADNFYIIQYAASTVFERRFRNSGGTAYDVGSTQVAGDFIIDTLHYDGSNLTSYINGATAATVAASGSMGALPQMLTLGSLAGGGFYYTDDIAEVLLYSRGISIAERRRIEGYLSRKYAIMVS